MAEQLKKKDGISGAEKTHSPLPHMWPSPGSHNLPAGRTQLPSLYYMAHLDNRVYSGISATPTPFLCLPNDFEKLWNADSYLSHSTKQS